MTIGVTETLGLLVIWLATMITLTALWVRDLIRRRRDSWRRHIAIFSGHPRRP